MREHLGLLSRTARGFAEGADQADLLPELCIALWRAEPSFRGESDPRTYIFRVAHNCALTWKRHEKRRLRNQTEFERQFIADNADPDPLLDKLYFEIRALQTVDRSLVLLWLEGQSYSEIAAVHGLSETNVGARLTRARKKLAEKMEDDDEF